MKRVHIIDLKSPIDPVTRLEVYKEAFREKTIINKHGLCLGLPLILWGHSDYFGKTPEGKEWSHGMTPYAFPELTHKIIMYIDEHKDNKDKLRMQFLSRAIQRLQEQLGVTPKN